MCNFIKFFPILICFSLTTLLGCNTSKKQTPNTEQQEPVIIEQEKEEQEVKPVIGVFDDPENQRQGIISLDISNNVIIYDKDDNVIFKGNGDKEWISLKNIDKDLINATIATEDKRFYGHNGFDYVRIIKSFFNNVSLIA